jgi:sorbitol/mannitol transport system substrate-binding protein
VTTDITTNGGQFDIMTIGMYETPIWGANGWLVPLDNLSEEYDVDDILPAMRAGLSHDGTLYAAPFYGESSMVMYRTDLMEAAGLEMPDAPTWQFIREAAAAMDDPENGVNGICLRGKAGWGEGGAFITVTGNSFGARWFDEDWNAQFDQPEWAEALNFYVNLMNDYGPDGYATNGFNENLSLFQQGLCGMWIDATVAASFVTNPNDSTVADSVGFALAPNSEGVDRRPTGSGPGRWRSRRARSRPTKRCSSSNGQPRSDYIELVAENEGWANVPRARAPRFTRTPTTSRCPSHR